MDEHEKALAAFEEGRALEGLVQFVEYGIAVVFDSMGENQKALEQLEKAAQTGLRQPEQLANDPDLASLKSNPRFAEYLRRYPVLRSRVPPQRKIVNSISGWEQSAW